MSIDRRGFLKSFIEPIRQTIASQVVRPPYNSDPNLFAIHCSDCEGNCISACPERIICRDDDYIPRLDFRVGACTFCQHCADECPHPVLDNRNSPVILGRVRIDPTNCLGWNDVICHTCAMICRERAVDLINLLKPSIIIDRCNRCGLCVRGCPTAAINITSK